MSVSFRIPTILRTYTGGEAIVSVEPSAYTLRGALEALEQTAPGISQRLLDESGALRRFINVYVNDDDVRFLGGLETELVDGAQISIVPAVAGG
jgi:molybdopterin converting factor small subunit